MPELPLDMPQDAIDKLRFAARLMGASESEVVARLIDDLSTTPAAEHSAPDLDPVAVHAVYKGHRVEGKYEPATQSLSIDSKPWSGQHFGSASGAAEAVIKHVNPKIGTANRSGFEFWRVTRTGEKLSALRGR